MNKKAQLDPLSLIFWVVALIAGLPWWLLLGIAVVGIVLLMMFWFALGKLLGVIMILGALWQLMTSRNWMAIAVMLSLGLLFFINPFSWERLAIMW